MSILLSNNIYIHKCFYFTIVTENIASNTILLFIFIAINMTRAIKGSHILVGTDGTVCLSGLRNSVSLPQEFETFRVAYHFPSHAVAVLPWMAPEILQQVSSSLRL